MSFVPSDDQETSLEEFKLNARSSKGLTVSKEQTLRGHLGNVKTNSPWELFVSSTSFDHLSELPTEADDEEEKSTSTVALDSSEDLLSPFLKRLLHISVLGFKRRFKEAFDLAESSQYNVEFDGWERTRLQVEAIWQRYMHRPDQEAKQCIRRLNELYVQSQRAYTEVQMQELKPVIYLYQGRIHYDQKHFGVAMRWYKEALMCCPEESLTHARLLDSMAIYYEHAGNFSHALHLMQDSLKIKSKLPFIHELGVSYQMLGQTNLLVEQFNDAQKHLERALSIAIQIKDSRREAELMNDLIKIAIINHQLIKALHLTNECMNRCEARRLWNAYGTARLYRAYIHFLNNELDDTYTLLVDDIIPLLKDYSNEKAYGTAFRLLGALYNSWGQRREALEALTESIVIFKRQNRHDELAKTYYEQARLYISLQQKDLAIQSLFHALNVAQQYNLMFLVRPIEDELFILAPEKWEKIAEHRLKYEAFTPLETMLKAHVASPENIQAAAMKVMNGSTKLDESVNGLASANPNALMSLLRLGQAISAERELDNILNLVREETVKALGAERCTVFVYDKETNELWSKVASGMEGKTFNKSDEDLLKAIAATTGITLENAMMVQEQKRSFESFILTLSSTIDARDPITAGHSERVADYSLLVGDELQMHRNDMEVLRFAALLHDIGKIGIREEVLTKEGRLTIDEYQHIQEHARFTFEILQNIHFAHHLQDVPLIAASHHERVDGKGYYKGLKGDEIPLSGRIIALGDVFDAITSLRHYRSRMPFDKVLSIIQKDAGSHFDSEVVDMFFRVPLYRLAEVLVKERRVKKIQEVSPLVKYIDRHVNLAEFHQILAKPEKTKAEQEIDKYFSAIYYVLPSKQQDNL